MNFIKTLYHSVKHSTLVLKSSPLFFFAVLLVVSSCSKEEMSSNDAVANVTINEEVNSEEANALIQQMIDFEKNQLEPWRAGDKTDQTIATELAIENMEGLLNLKLARGVVYKDEKFLTDSIDVPQSDLWTGTDVAKLYEGIKELLVKQYNTVEGADVGFRFVDISDIKVREDGTKAIFITGNVGAVKAGDRALKKASSFLWGSAETNFFPCSIPAETEIAGAFNFQLGCLSGNPPPPPNGTCGFFAIRTVAITPSAGTPGVPVDLIFASQSYLSGNTQAPAYPQEGQYVWHFDADQDENCFSFLKTNNYVFNQLSVAGGTLLTTVRKTYGTKAYQLFGESLFSEKRNIVFNGVPIVTYNAHLAFIYYGIRFIIGPPIEIGIVKQPIAL